MPTNVTDYYRARIHRFTWRQDLLPSGSALRMSTVHERDYPGWQHCTCIGTCCRARYKAEAGKVCTFTTCNCLAPGYTAAEHLATQLQRQLQMSLVLHILVPSNSSRCWGKLTRQETAWPGQALRILKGLLEGNLGQTA